MWFLELLVMIDLWENVLIAVKPSRNKIRTANHLILRCNYSSVTTFQQPSRFETKIEKLRNSERFLNWYLPNCSRKQRRICCSRKTRKLYFWVQYWQTIKSVAEKVETETSSNLPKHNKNYIFVFWGSHIIKNLVNFGAAYDTKKDSFLWVFFICPVQFVSKCFRFSIQKNITSWTVPNLTVLCPISIYQAFPFTPKSDQLQFSLWVSRCRDISYRGVFKTRNSEMAIYFSFSKGKKKCMPQMI